MSSLAALSLRRTSHTQRQAVLIIRRAYAVPINKKSSLEPALGTQPPQPPAPSAPTHAGTLTTDNWLNALRNTSKVNNAKHALLRPSHPSTQPQPQPQPQPQAQPQPQPPPAHTQTLNERVLEAARILRHHQSTTTATVEHLQDLHTLRAGRQLTIELPYESTPSPDRRVPIDDDDDGVLLLAYVADMHASRPTLSMCSAFPIAVDAATLDPVEDEPVGGGALAITCAHTLAAASSTTKPTPDAEGEGEASSLALAITRKGHVYAVRTLLSSIPQSDLVLLQLSEQPVLVPSSKTAPPGGFFGRNGISPPSFVRPAQGKEYPSLRTLPLSPYPPQPGETILVSSFSAWDQGSKQVDRARWGEASIVEYKDHAGREARVGTYDDLHQMDFRLLSSPRHLRPKIAGVTVPMPVLVPRGLSTDDVDDDFAKERDGWALLNRSLEALSQDHPPPSPPSQQTFPPQGSSGGPILSASTRAVIGVVRGSRTSVLEGHRGDGVPAEKVFEMFSLPGLGRKVLAERKKRAEGEGAVAAAIAGGRELS